MRPVADVSPAAFLAAFAFLAVFAFGNLSEPRSAAAAWGTLALWLTAVGVAVLFVVQS